MLLRTKIPSHSYCLTSAAHRHHTQRKFSVVVQSYTAHPDPVVTTQWLANHLDEVSILDVRGHVDSVLVGEGVEQSTYVADYAAYLEGHIPGAVFFDWTKDAVDTSAGAPVQLQMQPDLLAAALEAKGVSRDKPVVAYDAGDGMLAARLWWLLTVAGHPSALLLEGGWGRWAAEGRPAELYEPCTLKPQLRTTLEDIAGLLPAGQGSQQQQQQQQQVVLLDTRSAAQYTAQVRRGPRGGHIPGAISLPRPALLDEATDWLKPLEQQQQILQQAGIALPNSSSIDSSSSSEKIANSAVEQKVVIYCNGGVAACTAALALHRLGHRSWSVYDGSWNEYSASELPVAQQ
uniref:Rhodanese domain-containing protein n=1 Tax=Tetradesmus obliquus TaxID=3088 RepID=A0A383W482_TETOB